MSGKYAWAAVLRELWACREHGHLWGEQLYWGDSATDHRGTHRCGRCGRTGYPDEESP